MCTKSRSASGLNSPRGLVVTSSPAAVPLLRRSIRGCRAQVNDSRRERLGGVERTAAALCGSGSFQAESYQVVRMPGPAARVKRIAPPSKQLNSRELVRALGSSRGGLGSTLGQFGEGGDDLIAQSRLDGGGVGHANNPGRDAIGDRQ